MCKLIFNTIIRILQFLLDNIDNNCTYFGYYNMCHYNLLMKWMFKILKTASFIRPLLSPTLIFQMQQLFATLCTNASCHIPLFSKIRCHYWLNPPLFDYSIESSSYVQYSADSHNIIIPAIEMHVKFVQKRETFQYQPAHTHSQTAPSWLTN